MDKVIFDLQRKIIKLLQEKIRLLENPTSVTLWEYDSHNKEWIIKKG